MRKARMKKDKDATSTAQTNIEPTPESLDELAAATASPPSTPSTPTQHHHGAHDEGISICG